jgi:2,3,4,5-tetrahydropyridine-2,6-dicarboxylate N-succinyltransferase
MLIALVAVCGFFAVAAPQFLSSRNLSLLMTELAITGTLAMGMLLIILPGHIDLSVGSGVGLLGGIASVLVSRHDLPAPLALAVGLIVGVLLWLGMGTLIVREGSVLSMGVYLTSTTPIIDRRTGEVFTGEVPPYSVVMSGSRPSPHEGLPGTYCAVIMKTVDARTRAKTSINELLRD